MSADGGADATSGRSEFIDSLMDTELYSIGAYFCDEHPELVDEVIALSEEIERRGLEAYAGDGEGERSSRPSRPCSPGSRCATTRRSRAEREPWIPRVLLGLGAGRGDRRDLLDLGRRAAARSRRRSAGVNDVQRIFGGIPQDGAYLGPEDAETTITVFNDLQCAPCAEFEIETIDPLVEELRAHRRGADRVPPLLARAQRHHAGGDRRRGGRAAGAPVAVPRHLRPQPRARPGRGRSTRSSCARSPRPSPSSSPSSGPRTSTRPRPRSWSATDAMLAAELELPAEPAVVVSGPGGAARADRAPRAARRSRRRSLRCRLGLSGLARVARPAARGRGG